MGILRVVCGGVKVDIEGGMWGKILRVVCGGSRWILRVG